MSPTTLKTLMTIAAGLCTSLAFVPQLVPYAPALTAFAGFLAGGAHLPQPGAKAALKAAKEAVSVPPAHPRGLDSLVALLFLTAALALGGGTGCSSAPSLPALADSVGASSKLVVPMSRDALSFLQAERDRMVEAKLLSGDAVGEVDAALSKSDEVLKRVERGEKVTRQELIDAIDAASLVNETLVRFGARPPPLVASAIDVARRVVGERE